MANKTARKTRGTTTLRAKTVRKASTKQRRPAGNRQERPCACGCDRTTARTFAMGHDAKAKSLLLRVERGELKASDIPRSLRTAELNKDSLIARLLRKVGA
jgi:hypothetical protein